MKQGNGTEILGPDDPRAASIGIIYVSPNDERRAVLAAILMQENFGRKQVAVVLPPLNKAFLRPADFDDLRIIRKSLQTEVIFIAPSGPGPGEFACQRHFPVYSSLENYAQALREEQPIEAAPKKGQLPKSKAADASSLTPPAPMVPPSEQAEQDVTGHSVNPFPGGTGVGGTSAANDASHPKSTGDAVPSIPVYSVPKDRSAPASSAPPTVNIPLSGASPAQTNATNVLNGENNPDPSRSDLPPKQPRITGDVAKATPATPVSPLQPAPMSRVTRPRNSGKMDALGAGIAGAAGGIVAGRAAIGGGAPPLIHGTPSGTKRSGGSQRRRRLGWLLVLALLLLSLLLCSVVAFALPKQTQEMTSNWTRMVSNLAHPQAFSSSPMLTITPKSQVVENSYSIQAVTTGASATQHQVAARVLTANPSQQKTVTATGHTHTPGAQATGTLTFFNGSGSSYTVGLGTIFTDANGIQITNNGPVVIPANGSISVSAHAVNIGAAGNIPAQDFNFVTCCGSSFVKVSNTDAFTGGQDAKDYHFLQQSDFDAVANPLKAAVLAQAKSGTRSQIRSTERVARALQCSAPTATANQPIGDTGVIVPSATVTASASCTQEVYDQQGLQGLVEGLLKAKAGADPKLAGYAPVASIVTDTKVQRVDSNGTVTLGVAAKGKWVYQVDKTAIARLIAGLSSQQASAKLKSQPGIANFTLASGITTFPSNPAQISIEVVNVPGFSGGGETGTPVGSGPGTPSSGSTPQPGNG